MLVKPSRPARPAQPKRPPRPAAPKSKSKIPGVVKMEVEQLSAPLHGDFKGSQEALEHFDPLVQKETTKPKRPPPPKRPAPPKMKPQRAENRNQDKVEIGQRDVSTRTKAELKPVGKVGSCALFSY